MPQWLPAFFACNDAIAQVGAMPTTPTVGATSPLGMSPGTSVGPTGIPLGSTELTSPGLSPMPSGVTGTISVPSTASGAACTTAGTSPSSMFGSTASFDGGGMGTGAPAGATTADIGSVNVGDIELVEYPGYLGSVDNLGIAGYGGNVGNVRLRLKQHGFVVDPNLNGAHHFWRRRSNRNSVGIDRGRQSWGEFRRSGTDHDRIALSRRGGAEYVSANDARSLISVHRFIYDGKRIPVPEHRPPLDIEYSGRLLK